MVRSCAYCGGPVKSKGYTCSDECAKNVQRWKLIYERIKKSGLFLMVKHIDWSIVDDEPKFSVSGSLSDFERFIKGEEAQNWKSNCGLDE